MGTVVMKKRLGPTDRIYPMPCPLVVGGTIQRADALAVAWIGVASGKPPSVSMAIRRTRHTLGLIRETGEFTVNIPRAADAAVVDFFGIVSGRDHDKFAESGWTLEPASVISTPLIAECPYNLECRVTHELDIGEYVLVVGEVVESHAEETVLDATGEKVDVSALDPLVYIAGSREYRRLGERVADAFSSGKAIARDAEGF
jgi:flavin reductase (DIM6/NTAB) family NADH-FMN oxidoreductase RutF